MFIRLDLYRKWVIRDTVHVPTDSADKVTMTMDEMCPLPCHLSEIGHPSMPRTWWMLWWWCSVDNVWGGRRRWGQGRAWGRGTCSTLFFYIYPLNVLIHYFLSIYIHIHIIGDFQELYTCTHDDRVPKISFCFILSISGHSVAIGDLLCLQLLYSI